MTASPADQDPTPQPSTADPAMPHERDESGDTKPSSDSAPKGSRDVIRQAHDDIEAGQQDTDRHATPGLEKTRHRST